MPTSAILHLLHQTFRAWVCLACFFCVQQVFATTCISNHKLTYGKGGGAANEMVVYKTTGTLANVYIEVTLTATDASASANALDGDYCAFFFGKRGVRFQDTTGSEVNWTVTYGNPEISLSGANCNSIQQNYDATLGLYSGAFWISNVAASSNNTTAMVFYTKTGGANNACNASKLYIPIGIQYNATGSTTDIPVENLFSVGSNTVGGASVSGVSASIRKKTGSCTLTAPNLNLGNFNPNDVQTDQILGGKVKPVQITLTCDNIWSSGASAIKPTVVITDAANPVYGPGNCNPLNSAANGSNARFILFNTPNYKMGDPSLRYCVTPMNWSGEQHTNGMKFPDIASANYSASMPIYVGIRSDVYPAAPNPGPVSSTLLLNVSYE